MTIELAAALLTVLAIFSLITFPPLHPAQLWSAPWALAAVLFVPRLLPYPTPSSLTCWLIVLSSCAFVTAVAVGERLVGAKSLEPSELTTRGIAIAAGAASALALSGMCVFVAVVASRFGLKAALVPTAEVRLGLDQGVIPLAIKYLYFAFAATALTAIAARGARTARSRTGWLVLAGLCIGSTYFSTGRANMAIALVIALVAYLLFRPSLPSRATLALIAAGVGVVMMIIFVTLGNAIGRSFTNSSISSFDTEFSKHSYLRSFGVPYQYLTEPIAALDNQVRATGTWGIANGCADLSTGCRVLRAAGFAVHPVNLIRPETNSPVPFNIYTGLDLPLLDGGRALAVGIIAIEGLLVGVLWALARSRWPLGVVCYAIVSWAVLFAYSQNNFFAPHLLGAEMIALLCFAGGRSLAPASFRWQARRHRYVPRSAR